MKPRLNPQETGKDAFQAMLNLENYVRNCGLENSLIELVKIRASQVNGCAFCIHMHTKDARAHGESEVRIYLLDGWRESPLYTDRERAALTWTESLTLVAQTHAPDADYELLKTHFSPEEQANLTLLIGAINIWNRLCIGFRQIHPMETAPRA